MDLKGTLQAVTLDLRRELEGRYDADGAWQPGDLERRLAAIGVRGDRTAKPVDELTHLSETDRRARRVVDAFILGRAEAGQRREAAITDFVREAAYSWANRMLALRCMEARGLIDDVILQKDTYGGRSLQHHRLARKEPSRCSGEDEGLQAVLFDEFTRRTHELPLLFDPEAPEVALRPSVAALKRCIALLSGTLAAKGQAPATDEVFTAPEALGWAYQYWNTDEKDRVFQNVRPPTRAKIAGADIIPATCIYTEHYMVKFLIQNSLGAMWMGMYPNSRLCNGWNYYARDVDRAPTSRKPVRDIALLDPACGSGHFLIEAFDLFFDMYREEGALEDPAAICSAILEHNLFGIDIDERAVQIAAFALVMKAKERAASFVPRRVNLVATNIRLPAATVHVDAFLETHPEDTQLRPALLAIFEGLTHADELGSLLQLEAPVEKELRRLKAKYEAATSPGEQQALWEQYQKPVQGKLPIGVASYEAWKEQALTRIRNHFVADAHSTDFGEAFFGEGGAKGVSLVDLLSRRYDIVTANPPYMGSKNMGPVLKRYVKQHFRSGKRDLYAAFILRCHELTLPSGRVAMVMPQSWMFIRSYADLRASKKGTALLRTTSIELVTQLGRHAFSEADPPENVTLTILSAVAPSPDHRVTCFRLASARPASEQDALLRSTIADGVSATARFTREQQAFLPLPNSPLLYWIGRDILALFTRGDWSVGSMAEVVAGLSTGDNPRFVRANWEVPAGDRWVPYEKGGAFRKWWGLQLWSVDWQNSGARLEAFPGSAIRSKRWYFKAGVTYTGMARGCLGARLLEGDGIFASNSSSGVFAKKEGLANTSLAGILSSRLASYLLRCVLPKPQISEDYLKLLPLPPVVDEAFSKLTMAAVSCKRRLSVFDLLERAANPERVHPDIATTLLETWQRSERAKMGAAVVLHVLEAEIERQVFRAAELSEDAVQEVTRDTGVPVGWLPILEGYDGYDAMPSALSFDATELAQTALTRAERRALPDNLRAQLTSRLREVYEAGPGTDSASGSEPESDDESVPESDSESEEESGDGVDDGDALPTGRHLQPETFLEEMAQRLEIHPLSVYQLLAELRKKDAVVCKPELVRFVEDHVSALVLRLLGHRWRTDSEDASPAWVAPDGIIPITDVPGELTLLARMRERLAAEFGATRESAIEREFEDIVGKRIGEWLSTHFFRRHVLQFRKRPIAWQVQSSPAGDGRRGRAAARKAPAFSCLIYYHRLNTDLLPKLRAHYVGPLRTSLQTEQVHLEKLKSRTVEQDSRRLELEEKLDELKAFDGRLEQVIIDGFASPSLEAIAAEAQCDKWTSLSDRDPAPVSGEAFLSQERRYAPDLNDGVRVNIAPLQRVGLVAGDVLVGKDVESSINDRAEWRASERDWCREGRLARPGWWADDSGEVKPSPPQRGATRSPTEQRT